MSKKNYYNCENCPPNIIILFKLWFIFHHQNSCPQNKSLGSLFPRCIGIRSGAELLVNPRCSENAITGGRWKLSRLCWHRAPWRLTFSKQTRVFSTLSEEWQGTDTFRAVLNVTKLPNPVSRKTFRQVGHYNVADKSRTRISHGIIIMVLINLNWWFLALPVLSAFTSPCDEKLIGVLGQDSNPRPPAY